MQYLQENRTWNNQEARPCETHKIITPPSRWRYRSFPSQGTLPSDRRSSNGWKNPFKSRSFPITRIWRRSHRPDYAKSRSEEHTSELQSLMRISYAVLCLKKKIQNKVNKQIIEYTTTKSAKNKKY